MEASGAGAPAVVAPVVIWNENPLTGIFNLGTVAGQNISLEKTKGLATEWDNFSYKMRQLQISWNC